MCVCSSFREQRKPESACPSLFAVRSTSFNQDVCFTLKLRVLFDGRQAQLVMETQAQPTMETQAPLVMETPHGVDIHSWHWTSLRPGGLATTDVVNLRVAYWVPQRLQDWIKEEPEQRCIAGGFVAAIGWETQRSAGIRNLAVTDFQAALLTQATDNLATAFGDIDLFETMPQAEWEGELERLELDAEYYSAGVALVEADTVEHPHHLNGSMRLQHLATNKSNPSSTFDFACCRLELRWSLDARQWYIVRDEFAEPVIRQVSAVEHSAERLLKYLRRGYAVVPGGSVTERAATNFNDPRHYYRHLPRYLRALDVDADMLQRFRDNVVAYSALLVAHGAFRDAQWPRGTNAPSPLVPIVELVAVSDEDAPAVSVSDDDAPAVSDEDAPELDI